MSECVAILGAAGAIGRAAADEFERRGDSLIVIGRDEAKLGRCFSGRAEIRAADLNDALQTASALHGASSVVYTVGLPYPQFEMHPVLMRSALDAARRAGVARMVVVSSVYSYGHPVEARVSEDHPRQPETRKGRCRREQEDAALEADGRGGLRTTVLHLPDFYGPYAEVSLARMILQWGEEGKPANWLGNPDAPHEFVFVPDTGAVIAGLLQRDSSFGRRWNFAGPGTITGRDFVSLVYRELSRPVRLRAASEWLVRLLGLFNPMMRELAELHYLGVTPVLLDDARLLAHLGSLHKTPYAEGVKRMVEWCGRQPRS